jgi:hypothetical protein
MPELRTKQTLQKKHSDRSPDIPDIDQTIVDLDPEDHLSAKLRRRLLLRRFWESGSYFWRGADQRASWLLTAAILLTTVLNLAVSYGMNLWNRGTFDALAEKAHRLHTHFAAGGYAIRTFFASPRSGGPPVSRAAASLRATVIALPRASQNSALSGTTRSTRTAGSPGPFGHQA